MTQEDAVVEAVLPDEPPVLGDAAWRALLAILVGQAEAEHGPDWRAHLSDDLAAK